MKKIHQILIFILVFCIFGLQTNANTYIEQKIDGKTIKIIEYELGSEEYDISIGYTPDETNIRQLMIRNNGVTAINGVFFCPADYSECGGKTFTINEHYSEGEKVAGIYDSTGDRVVFGWDKNQIPFLYQTDKINPEREKDIYEGFANHPLLLKNGENRLEYYYDSYLIDKKMLTPTARNFICNDKEKKNIYFGIIYDVSLDDIIPILKKIGCSDALNLDAGRSTAFVYNGKYIVGPQRPILDGVIIKRKGLEIGILDKKAQMIVDKLSKKIQKRTYEQQKKIFSRLSNQLVSIQNDIYDKSTLPLQNEDGERSGYKIEIKNLNTLKKVYYINSLVYYISQKNNSLNYVR